MSNIGQGFKPKATAARLPQGSVACKCQICNCGSHKCPSDRHLFVLTPYEADMLRSSYRTNYPAHPCSHIPTRDEHRPKQEPIFNEAKFDAKSTTASDFKPHGAGAARQAKPPVGDPSLINGGSASREFTSENRAEYAPKGYSVRENYAPHSQHTTKLPFDGISTTSADFKSHVGSGAKPSTPFKENATVGGQREDRDFQTEAALKFVSHPGSQRRSGFAPVARGRDSVPFEGQSTTSADYRPTVGGQPAKSFAPQQTHLQDRETRDFKSSNQVEYQPKGWQVRESYKPRDDRTSTNVPFNAESTSKSDFTGERGQKAQSARPRMGLTDTIGVAIGSRDDRDFASESHGKYDPKGYQARQPYIPQNSHSTQVPFEGVSTTTQDYHRHTGAKPSTPYKAQSFIGTQREDRDFQSENALKFPQHEVQKVRESYHPNNRVRAALPFEGESTTKSDYRPFVVEGCPAAAIPDFPNQRPNEEGHQLLTNTTGSWQPVAQTPQQVVGRR